MDEVRAYAGQILGMQLVTHQTGPEGQKVRRLQMCIRDSPLACRWTSPIPVAAPRL